MLFRSFQQLDTLMNENDLVFETYGKIREIDFYQGSVDGQMIFPNLELIQHLDADIEIR